MNNQSAQVLEWMLEYEIRASHRYGHNVALVMMATSDRQSVPRSAIAKTFRACDEFFRLFSGSAVIMGETGRDGALTAIERYGFSCSGNYDLRFAVSNFPEDGETPHELITLAGERLDQALAGTHGPVVTAV